MEFDEIINLEAGTLLNFSSNRSLIKLNKIKNKTESDDQSYFFYYADNIVKDLIKMKRLHIFDYDKTSWKILRTNGQIILQDLPASKEICQVNSCLGMSLGVSFVATQPLLIQIYRQDFRFIYLFHKILHSGQIKWIVLQSKMQYTNFLDTEPEKILRNLKMNLT